MKIKKRGSAAWHGGLKDGKGAITTESGALDAQPYGFGSRFEGRAGTNPEELIGAAHAGCFTMALAKILEEAGHAPESLDTTAEVTLERGATGFEIPAIHLKLEGRVPGLDAATFETLAGRAKAGCPVSKVLRAEITLEARLLS